MKRIALLIALLCSPLYGQIKFSELPAKTAGSSTASQIFFPLVEMDGTPSTHRMSAVELGNLVGASISDGDKGAIVVTSGVWGFDPVVVTPFSQTLLDNGTAALWRSELGLGSAATSAASEFAAVAHAHSATDITSGTMLTARLGSGTASDAKFLRGDSTWSNVLTTGIVLGGTTVTTDTPLVNAVQIWNAGGVSFSGIKIDIQNSASAAGSRTYNSLSGGVSQWSVDVSGTQWVNDATTWLKVNSTSAALGVSGSDWQFSTSSGAMRTIINNGLYISDSGSIGWNNGTVPISLATVDTLLYRDAARVIAMRSATQAQQFRVYNTYTSGTNYERATLDWQTTANTFRFGTQKGSGGGTARAMAFVTDDIVRMTIDAGGSIDIPEMTAPAAPAANTARLYVDDSGGKTRLMVRFPTGAAVQIAIEP